MDHRLIVFLLIFTGILPLVLSVDRKYFLINEKKSWSDAQAYCQANYTDLATIDTSNDTVNIQKEAVAKAFYSRAWIGLYTEINKWLWSFENEQIVNFTSWNVVDPNNLLGDEWCGFIYLGKWYDAPCEWQLQSVCFDGRENATDRYILITQLKTWYDAQSYCRQKYTDLASARNATENSIIAGKNLGVFVWFGLCRDPWKWSDQTSNVSILKWWAGDANDYLQNKSCGFLYGGLADQAQCSNVMPFFCYEFPTQKQILKVKVKSSQDVNDPATLASIFEKINQTLVDHRMAETITVKWRQQSDGVVFHKEKENVTKIGQGHM
ncbi:macrophage mannose receptor 1-like [Silurus meridionalis]|uniref:C-type lectin domain-containing protein n=1 Tax=Silurus meridionalis TaxID=175797 RepID=A0A8T0BSG6_SILME|nr:macrophage mannose receptor 1-like [Silurus meridionalis]KAF7710019.1 hypothetical protein HF521_008891 [Silurus meridionalis]